MAEDEEELYKVEEREGVAKLVEDLTQKALDLKLQLRQLSEISPKLLGEHKLDLADINEELTETKKVLKTIRDLIPKPEKPTKEQWNTASEFPAGPLNIQVLEFIYLAEEFFTANPGLIPDPSGVYNFLMYDFSAPDEWHKDKSIPKTHLYIGTSQRLDQYFDKMIDVLNKHRGFDKNPKVRRNGECDNCTRTQKVFGYRKEDALNAIEQFRKYCYAYFGIEG